MDSASTGRFQAAAPARDALAEGILLFHADRFFEAHEAWEAAWMAERGSRRLFWQGLIHLAAACHHGQRGNLAGAERQFRKGLRKLAGFLPACEGVDTARLYETALGWLEGARVGRVPPSPRIPLQSP